MSHALDADAIRDRLARFPSVLRAAARVVDPADARWKPGPEHWSILEICCHLRDEEREDFRVRIESTLTDPAKEWPKLGLEGIAEKRGYNGQDLADTLDAFADARAANISWLDDLHPGAPWTQEYVHPKFGSISAGALLAAWAAHDALHLRQIAKRLHQLAVRDGGPHPTTYAGEW